MKRIIFCSTLVCSLMLMSFFQKANSGITKVSQELYKIDDGKFKFTKEDEDEMKKSIMEAYGMKSLSGDVKLKFIEGEASRIKGWDYRQIASTRVVIGGGEFVWRQTRPTERLQKPQVIKWEKYIK